MLNYTLHPRFCACVCVWEWGSFFYFFTLFCLLCTFHSYLHTCILYVRSAVSAPPGYKFTFVVRFINVHLSCKVSLLISIYRQDGAYGFHVCFPSIPVFRCSARLFPGLPHCFGPLLFYYAPPGCFWPASLSPSLWGPCRGSHCHSVV